MTSGNVKKVIKNVGLDTNMDVNQKVFSNIVEAFEKSKARKEAPHELSVWRIIMKNRITKFAAAAGLIILVLIGINQFGGSVDVTSTAFAGVVKQLRSTHTLTCSMVMQSQQLSPKTVRMEIAYKEPGYTRIVVVGGTIGIMDYTQKKGLNINPLRKEFTEIDLSNLSTSQLRVDLIIEELRTLPDQADEELGEREMDGQTLRGFRVTKDKINQIVWVDSETGDLVRIESSNESTNGPGIHGVMTDFQFDVDLDDSLFSLTPPEGYKLVKELHFEMADRLKSAVNVDRILKACRKYVQDHGGQWPNNLHELTEYGVGQDTLSNPRQPAREVGYVYLKPPASPSESRIVLYETYKAWEGGINVGFANYHLQFIKEESAFEKLLKQK